MATKPSGAPARCSPGRRTRVVGGNGVTGRLVVTRRLVASGLQSLVQPRLREQRRAQVDPLGLGLPGLNPLARATPGFLADAAVVRIAAACDRSMCRLGLAPDALWR